MAGARDAVERVVAACTKAPDPQGPSCSVSAGIAEIIGRETQPKAVWDVVQEADRALYRAKLTGKRRVVGVKEASPPDAG